MVFRGHVCPILVAVSMLAACLPSSGRTPEIPPTSDACAEPSVITLDAGWRFRTDPRDIGTSEQWYSAKADDSAWQRLAPGKPWESSGLEYDGVAWYRIITTVPSWPAVYLGFGAVDDAATLWANGEWVMTWKTQNQDSQVVDLREFSGPGEDIVLALRIEDEGGYGGIKGPLRLSDKPREVMADVEYIRWLAETHPGWPMPAWIGGGPLAWTISGLVGRGEEALVGSGGAVAPWAAAPTAEVWLYDPATSELAWGTQRSTTFSLQNGHLPMPKWEWRALDTTVKSVLFGDVREQALRWQVTVSNAGEAGRELVVLVVVRPFGINRSVAPMCSVGLQGKSRLWVDGSPFLVAGTPPVEAGVGPLDEAVAAATRGRVPSEDGSVSVPSGRAAMVMAYRLSLDVGQSEVLQFAFPAVPGEPFPTAHTSVERPLDDASAAWEQAVNQVSVDVPDELVQEGVRASTAYILLALDPDGPHPGPLTHDAMWVRDAAYIGLALLQLGHAQSVRAYLPDVFAAQEASGRIPPIQGNEIPWDENEWDSQGQAIFLVTTYYRYTGAVDVLRDHYPALRAAARFIVELRAAQDGSDESTRGLLPPSKSAEDLGPSDRHYFWDNFWCVVGLEEAAYAARQLGETHDAAWMQAEANALRSAILASVQSVMGDEPAYIPGAVEDLESSAMARGTVPALWPIRVLSPGSPLVKRSFAVYHQRWIEPDDGGFRHRQGQFWPYGGLELAHAYLRLGRTDVLHQILGWTLQHQTLPGTFAWAEQVDPETGGFSGGDMPHAWAAASYATLVREMVISEAEDSLRLFTGVPNWWLEAERTITLENAPTHFGELDLHVESTVDQTDSGWDGDLTLVLSGAKPPQGFRWDLPCGVDALVGPPGVKVDGGWLIIPRSGGTVQLTFSQDE